MTSVTGEPAQAGWARGPGVDPGPDRADAACRWCGERSAWAWSLGGEAPGDLDGWSTPDEVRVCAECQALTLAGADAAVLDRYTTMLTTRVTYPVAVDFLREQRAAWLAHWVLRRTTVRPVREHAAGAVR